MGARFGAPYIVFCMFVVANSYFCFKEGEKAGRFMGMITITQFFQSKSVLKDKKEIVGFRNWPKAIQLLYLDPREEIFKD